MESKLTKSISKVQAIDVHAHFGKYHRGQSELRDQWCSGGPAEVLKLARLANTRFSIVSPTLGLLPRGRADVLAANEQAAKVVAENEGLGQWIILNPLDPRTYEQAERMLKNPKCMGIKIHPEEHVYPVAEHGREIFEFAAKHQAIILTHSGEKNSMPEDFVVFADDFPQVTLILAHHGCGWDNDPSHQVRAIQACKKGNMFTDTSSSTNITPGQIEYAVRGLGPERILYGTDSPLYFAPMHRVRINLADISDQAKRLILHDNAAKLFGL